MMANSICTYQVNNYVTLLLPQFLTRKMVKRDKKEGAKTTCTPEKLVYKDKQVDLK